MAIEIAGLHISDPRWPKQMAHMLSENQELIELASYFQPKANSPPVYTPIDAYKDELQQLLEQINTEGGKVKGDGAEG